jgi:hypothetical protein
MACPLQNFVSDDRGYQHNSKRTPPTSAIFMTYFSKRLPLTTDVFLASFRWLCRLCVLADVWRALVGFGGLAEALADSGMLWRGLDQPWRTMADTGTFRWTLVGFGGPLPHLGKCGGVWRPFAALGGNP